MEYLLGFRIASYMVFFFTELAYIMTIVRIFLLFSGQEKNIKEKKIYTDVIFFISVFVYSLFVYNV